MTPNHAALTSLQGVGVQIEQSAAGTRCPGKLDAGQDTCCEPGHPDRSARRPQDYWPAPEKLRVLRAATGLSGSELGALLRREGVHEADLTEWREQADKGALTVLSGTRQPSADQKRIRKLESELRRKEKALAEAAALLVLSKTERAPVSRERPAKAGRQLYQR